MTSRPSIPTYGGPLPNSLVRTLLDGSQCCALGLGFVASLYVWPDSRGPLHALVNLTEAATDMRYFYDREHPSNIRKRFISTSVVGLLSTTYFCYLLGNLGDRPALTSIAHGGWKLATKHLFPLTTFRDIFVAVGVTSVLFSGVIATKVLYKDERPPLSDASDDSVDSDPSQDLGSETSSFNADVVDSDEACESSSPALHDNPITIAEALGQVIQPKAPSIKFPKSQRRDTRPLTERRRKWQFLRNYVICPLVEEVLFRAVMWKVVTAESKYGPLPTLSQVSILAFAFGMSHVHHVLVYAIQIHQNNIDPLDPETSRKEAWRRALLATSTQAIMTSVFSLFNTFIYTRITHQNILASALIHSYVNYLGPPSTAYLYRQDPFIRSASRIASVDSIALHERTESKKKKRGLKLRIYFALRRAKRALLDEPTEWKVRKKTNVITGCYYSGMALFGLIVLHDTLKG